MHASMFFMHAGEKWALEVEGVALLTSIQSGVDERDAAQRGTMDIPAPIIRHYTYGLYELITALDRGGLGVSG
jgi:hypothetical protein